MSQVSGFLLGLGLTTVLAYLGGVGRAAALAFIWVTGHFLVALLGLPGLVVAVPIGLVAMYEGMRWQERLEADAPTFQVLAQQGPLRVIRAREVEAILPQVPAGFVVITNHPWNPWRAWRLFRLGFRPLFVDTLGHVGLIWRRRYWR